MNRFIVFIILILLTVAVVASTAVPPVVSTVLLNNFNVVYAHDSILFAAGNNAVMSARFNTESRQYRPFDYLEIPGPSVRIKRFDSVLVVQSTAGSLSFFRVNALPIIVFLGTINLPNDYMDFAVRGDRLFLACGFEGVRMFTINGYSGLSLVDSSVVPVHAIACELNQDRLLVVDDYIGVFTFRPLPSLLGPLVDTLYLSSSALSIASRNDSVFIGSAHTGITLARIANDTLSIVDTLPTHFASARIELVDTLVLSISPDGVTGDLVSLSGHLNSMWSSSGEVMNNGSTFSTAGTSYLVAPTTEGNLMLTDLGRIETDLLQPRPAYPFSGKISDVCIFQNTVIVARQSHPMLAYPLAVTVPPELPNAILPGFAGVDQVESVGSMLVAYSRYQHSLVMISGIGAQYTVESSIAGIANEITGFRIADKLFDTSRLLFLLGDNFIDLHSLSTTWESILLARLYFPETPIDVAYYDSLILVGTVQNVYVYSINSTVGMTHRSTVSLHASSPNQDPLVRLLSPDISSTGYQNLIRRNSITSYDLTTPNQPMLVNNLDIPIGITDATRMGDHIIVSSIDRGALRVYSPPLSSLVVIDSVQLVGYSISGSGSKVALAGNGVVWLIDWTLPMSFDEDEVATMPGSFELTQNYPNPFNPVTTVEYNLFQPSTVSLVVYNLLGEKVRQLVDKREPAGHYRISFDGTGLSSGVYFYRLNTESGSTCRKMVLIK